MNSVFDLNFQYIKNNDFDLHRAKVESAYQLIKSVWTRASVAIGSTEKIYSDDFLHSDIIGLFKGDNCIGLMLAKFGDLNNLSFKSQKYFDTYGDEILSQIIAINSSVDLWHKITIHPEWSRKNTNQPILDILFGLMIKRFFESNRSIAIGITNNTFKIDVTAKKWNLETIATKSTYNILTDIMICRKNKLYKHNNDEINRLVNSFWGAYEREIFESDTKIRNVFDEFTMG